MVDMEIIQIVPGLTPDVDGIGDYGLKLARGLRNDHGIRTRFLVANPRWKGGPVDRFPARAITKRTPEGLREGIVQIEAEAGLGQTPVFVHFSVYGYQRRGCPFWLATGLENLSRVRLGSIHIAFHELENHGWKPWSSTFWLPRIQRAIIKRVARLGTFRYTNTELHRRKLEDWGVGRIIVIPNFSTLGEPVEYPPFSDRQKHLVIFGRPAQRQSTYDRSRRLLGSLCRRIGVTRIFDIGDPVRETSMPHIEGVSIVRCGRLSEEEVNARMADSIASFMQYPIPLLTKSTAHAVSCAFGTIPFVYDNGPTERSCPLLVTGEDFIPVRGDLCGLEVQRLDVLSRKVFDHYQARASRVAVANIAQHLLALRDRGRVTM
jgi:hypothetical protein